MAMILDGKSIAGMRLEILKEEIEESGLYPHLATVIAGSDPASQMYIRMKHRACEQVQSVRWEWNLPADATTGPGARDRSRQLNEDADIDGILMQLPLPEHVDSGQVIGAVRPEKDVDGFHPFNLGLLFSGDRGLLPARQKGS